MITKTVRSTPYNVFGSGNQCEVVTGMLKRFIYTSNLILSIMVTDVMAQASPDHDWEVGFVAASAGHGSSALNETLRSEVRYFFGGLENRNSPLAETNFVNRRSSLAINFQRDETEQIAFFGIAPVASDVEGGAPELNTFTNSWGIKGLHFFDSFGLFFGGSFGRSHPSGVDTVTNEQSSFFTSTSPEESDIDRYSVTGGAFVFPQTRLSVTYSSTERSVEQRFELNLPFLSGNGVMTFKTETETEEWGMRLRHLGQLGSLDYSAALAYGRETISTSSIFSGLNGDVQSSETTLDVDKYNLTATLYPTKKLGLNLLYGQVDNSAANVDTYGLGAQWFINHNVAVLAQYSRADLQFGQQSEAYVAELLLRF